MITEYPDTIISKFGAVILDPYQDEATGDWVIPPENGITPTVEQAGRAEVNGAAVKVPGKDGEKVDYSFMIYLPQDAQEIPYNADVEIKNSKGEAIGKGTVKRFHRGTMNARLWV